MAATVATYGDIEPSFGEQRCYGPEGSAVASRAVDQQHSSRSIRAAGSCDVNVVILPGPPGLFRLQLRSQASPGREERGIRTGSHPLMVLTVACATSFAPALQEWHHQLHL